MPNTTVSFGKPRLPMDTGRTDGGTKTHLSPVARALVIERIIVGDTNAQINTALRQAGLLCPGQNVSDRALTPYRKSEAVRTHDEQLTLEARQVGYAALSEAVVVAASCLNAAAEELLDERTGGFRYPDDDTRTRTAASIFFGAANFLWNRIGYTREELAQDRQSRRQARDAEAEERRQAEYERAVEEGVRRALRELLARHKAAQAGNNVQSETP